MARGGISGWWKERQLRKTGRQIGAMIDASLVGKPPWAMQSRLLGITVSQAERDLSGYLTALEQQDAVRVHDLADSIADAFARAAELAGEIDLEGRDDCIAALLEMEGAIRREGLPSTDALARVHDFVDAAFC